MTAPRLVLLNGPPGSGKSTIAARFVDDHPLALNLDIDRVRALLGGWEDRTTESGLQARRLALAMARTHLVEGHEVVVPQFLGRLEFVEQLAGLADEVGIPFVEVALLPTRQTAVRRFVARTATATAAEPAHLEAHRMVERAGGVPALEAMYDRLLDVLAKRPATLVLVDDLGDPEATYERFAALLD